MIKPIEEIPQSIQQRQKSKREMLRQDLRDAINQKISKFEFVGDYNFKYLAQYAREEANRVIRGMSYKWMIAHPEYKAKGVSPWFDCIDQYHMADEIFKINSVKGETPDNRRVFCVVNLDIDSVFKKYADNEVEKIEERKKWKEMEKNGLQRH